MPITVSHTYYGTVTVIDHASTNRYRLTPAEAESTIRHLQEKLDTSTTVDGAAIQSSEDGTLHFNGSREAFLIAIKDLTKHAGAARAACDA